MKEWITGRNPVLEALQAQRRQFFKLLLASGVDEKGRISEILRIAAMRGIPVERVTRDRIDRMGENPQGVALEASEFPYVDLTDILDYAETTDEDLFVLVLDLIQNPQNLGTLLRTAEAVGVHGVVLPQHRAAGITPAVVTASAGASEYMLVTQLNINRAIDQLKQAGAWVVGLAGEPTESARVDIPFNGPIAIVVGNEGEGIRPLVRKSCDFILSLSMRGRIESLNAAVAGSIVLYQAMMARRKAKEN
jgi:23S rRNA (guanosine2251-2'-O)-methyltransferase